MRVPSARYQVVPAARMTSYEPSVAQLVVRPPRVTWTSSRPSGSKLLTVPSCALPSHNPSTSFQIVPVPSERVMETRTPAAVESTEEPSGLYRVTMPLACVAWSTVPRVSYVVSSPPVSTWRLMVPSAR